LDLFGWEDIPDRELRDKQALLAQFLDFSVDYRSRFCAKALAKGD
jgi:hypothetical protein